VTRAEAPAAQPQAPRAAAEPRRRVLLVAGVGAAAGLVGVGAALWFRPGPEEVAPSLWTTRLPRAGGGEVDFASLRGRPLLLNFWATWCAPCKEEMPWFADLQQRYGPQGLQVIGVAMDDSDKKVIDTFAKKMGVNYPVLLGKESVATAYGDVQFLPDTFYIGRDGKILRHVQGLIDRKSIEQEVKSALAASGSTARNTPLTFSGVRAGAL